MKPVWELDFELRRAIEAHARFLVDCRTAIAQERAEQTCDCGTPRPEDELAARFDPAVVRKAGEQRGAAMGCVREVACQCIFRVARDRDVHRVIQSTGSSRRSPTIS